MAKVIVDMSMSLDGFIAGPNISRGQPLGEGGRRLHEWIFDDKTDQDAQVLKETTETSGAVIVGWRTYSDAIDDAWEGVTPFRVPAFVLAKHMPQRVAEGFTVVTDGIDSALVQAKTIAGEKNVWVMGGANTVQQFLKAGLIDEIQIHLIPTLLGRGTPLFDQTETGLMELEKIRVIEAPGVTHLKFRIAK